jgi:hypothetical protein
MPSKNIGRTGDFAMQAERLWNVKAAACVAAVQWSTKDFGPGFNYSIRSTRSEISWMAGERTRIRWCTGILG